MAWYNTLGRAALGAATLGGSELVQRNQGVHDWLLGGTATNGMSSAPQTADYQRGYLQNNFMTRPAPQMSTGQSDQTRGQQNQLAGMLFNTATGQQMGPGASMVQRGINTAQAAQTSNAMMARGADSALAGRTAARNAADIGVNGAGQMGIAQMQDVNNAQGQLAGLLGQTRSQDIGVAQGNQQAQMQQQQLQLSALAQMLGVDQATLQQELAKRGLQMQDKGMLPGLLQVGGQIGAAAAA